MVPKNRENRVDSASDSRTRADEKTADKNARESAPFAPVESTTGTHEPEKNVSVFERARDLAQRFWGTSGAEEESDIESATFSWRMLGALVLLVVLIGSLYPTLQTFYQQDQELKSVTNNVQRLTNENAQLRAEQTWWDDDNYVRQQARSRLFYISAGDIPLTVTGLDDSSSKADASSANGQDQPEESWTTRLWSSLEQ
ncbi:MAG: septum formation initiator family protein [Rothia sp. (in: high G+C Gram-positive bacteria)]|uniref:septum formation initiator family protein n=1 Tax=Rothia sp. (in: high G+C Gram-positive bacteria) TaxID=1885016 RepID=UPI0026E09498|nr:septum formation initiator family protein [Rothia sp. (in: high G+C Gram-positive bacteria)]MDO5750255.1 septum formation initiator family protein [Rothia sp. (in: high G+C Gram-positive bacteria)]